MVRLFLLFIPVLISACSGSSTALSNSGSSVPQDTRNPVSTLLSTRDVLLPSSRLPAYSKTAGRLSLIDPLAVSEVWNVNASGYLFGIALPEFSGATLFADDSVEVVTQSARKKFPLSGQYYFTAAVANHASYALARSDSRSIDVIHSLDNGTWQFETLQLPWIAPASEPEKSTALLFDEQGINLMAVSLYDGAFGVFSASGAGSPFTFAGQTCEGVERNGEKNWIYSSLVWHQAAGVILLGDYQGKIYSINPTTACQPVELQPATVISAGNKILSITIAENNDIYVLTEFGVLFRLQTDGVNITTPQTLLTTSCRTSSTVLPLNSQYLLLVCASDNETESAVSRFFKVPSIRLEYMTFDINSGELVSSFSVLQEESAGTGIDKTAATMYRLKDHSFGVLETYNLLNGQRQEKAGLFLHNLLDDL